jgi:cell division protein FtsW (lipid II flippase)
MNDRTIYKLEEKARQISWPLLVFLLLVLNVKLVVKVAAIIIISIINWKLLSVKDFFTQRYLFFYFGLACIGLINLLLQLENVNTTYLFAVSLGVSFWMMSAVIAYQLYKIVQQEKETRLHNTVSVFFMLHIAVIFINFLQIVFETGSINPYTYKGLNQKYYISTGDFITGITFDAPVTTAFICAFGLLYFLYRQRFFLSVACMAALIIMASNFANLILLAVFVFSFVFYSSRVQKSFIIVYMVMLIVFMVKISPQNNEHVGRIFYQVINKPYDLPPVKVIPLDELKKLPDSVLTFEERRKKYAQNYIDSMNSIRPGISHKAPENNFVKAPTDSGKSENDKAFYQFKESEVIEEKINLYTSFLNQMYDDEEQDSLKKLYNWKSPGKWIAGKQLVSFLENHTAKILLGNGIGNFSSRIAFKATILNIAGRYPEKLKYINPDFLYNHLYLYLYFHSQDQSKHEASNTPDAVYYQLAGEYGIVGVLLLLFLYFGFFIRHIRKLSFGLPLFFLLAGAFFAEYWFEQFSIVVLFELLFFLDMKDLHREEQTR